ncbi:MAG: tetratricopeptide repeat protein [Candidatus Riflebacteria bacterium]|nr:tetratricopeptide repeat protein [Candidatus Riflebacteria bacterium]
MQSWKRLALAALLGLALGSPGPAVAQFDNTNILVEEAVNHIYQQRFKQAHALLKQAYDQSPRHPGVHFNLGRLFEMTGNFSEACKEYQMAAVLDPSNVAARRGLARCSVELKRTRGAEQARVLDVAAQEITATRGTSPVPARPVVARPPAAPPPAPVISQGRVAAVSLPRPLPDIDDAPSTPAIDLPAMPPSSQLPAAASLPPMPQAVRERMRDIPYDEEESRAEGLIEKGSYAQAFELLDRLSTNNPDNPRVLFLLGKLFSLKGEMFNGIKYLEEAVKVDERMYHAYYLLAQDYSRVNLLDDAIRNYLVYFGVKPQAGVAVEIARVYERMGRQAEAREFYAKANAMNPGNPNLQAHLTQSENDVANDLYLRANHAFTTNDFAGAATLFEQALSSRGLDGTYRRDAERKVQAAKLRARVQSEEARPAAEGFRQTRATYGTVNLLYPQLADITFKTKFTGPVVAEWRAYVARKFTRYGQDFLVMIKDLTRDEQDMMGKEQADFRLNPNFTNQPVFLLTAPRGAFPPFADKGKFLTFTGRTEWRFYDVINDLGQSMKLPAFEYMSAHP